MKYLSLFTVIGGLDAGMDKLGFDCVGFSEIKESSIKIYNEHFPDRKNYGDITEISYKELPSFDILTGGFPCQSFSLAGLRKGLNDTRGIMILHIYNLLVAKKPKYFVLENVKGILSHDKGQTYIKIHQLLKSAGYFVRTVLLNSRHFGSAQARERVFFLGSLEDFPIKRPEKTKDSVLFKDIRDIEADKKFEKIGFDDLKDFDLELIGDYDRVGTLTTGNGCGNKKVAVGEDFRGLSILECERLQNFPEGWTNVEGVKDRDKYWALGNAVNYSVSEYLFGEYLKGLWYE
jgi:DNA-cytosine methyltransferase